MKRESILLREAPTSSERSIIDLPAVLDRVGGDEELLHEIIEIFFEEYPTLVADISSAIDKHDWRVLERSAHTLKGSVSNFGAQSATQAAHDLELIARRKDLHLASGTIEMLKGELVALHSALMRLQAS